MTTRELNSLPVRQLELQDKQGQQMQQGSRNEEKERLWCHWRARRAAGGRPPKRSYVSPRRRTSHPFPDGSIPIRLPLSVLPGRLFCMSLRVCAVWISFVSSAAISLTRSTASQQRQRQAFSALFLFCLRRRTFCRHCVRKVLLTKFNTYCASLGVRFVACLHKETQTEFMLWHFKLRNFYEIRWLRLPSTSLLNLQQPLATATEILGQFEANFFVQHSNNIQKKQKKGRLEMESMSKCEVLREAAVSLAFYLCLCLDSTSVLENRKRPRYRLARRPEKSESSTMIYDDDVSWNARASPPKEFTLHSTTHRKPEKLQDVLPLGASLSASRPAATIHILAQRIPAAEPQECFVCLDFEYDSVKFAKIHEYFFVTTPSKKATVEGSQLWNTRYPKLWAWLKNKCIF